MNAKKRKRLAQNLKRAQKVINKRVKIEEQRKLEKELQEKILEEIAAEKFVPASPENIS